MPTDDAVLAGIAELATRFALTSDAQRRLSALIELIARDPQAPTAVHDRKAVLDDHVADSLVALELPVVREATRVVDIGSGAGFPGIPLAISLASASVSLVESSARKCGFLERAARRLGLANVRVVNARAEAWHDGLEQFDAATVRAVASLAVVAEYGAPLLRRGGTLIAWRGRRDPDDERAGARAGAELGLESLAPRQVWPYAGAQHRFLHLMLKVRETPERFPRRPGMARKRPLGAG